MKETIKKAFLGGIVFLGTVILGFYGFAAYTNLPTQNTGDTITQSIWNDVINKINSIGNNVDTLSGSQLGVGQTWQNVLSSRVVGTTYTNTTGKPIQVNIRSDTPGGITLAINGIQVGGSYASSYARGFITATVPNNGTYVLSGMNPSVWAELR